MFSRRRTQSLARQPAARGGVSFGAVLTGVMVALGAMVVLSAATAVALVAFHFRTDTLDHGSTTRSAVALIVGFAVVQLIAYTWGGYTAGRMARGAGVINGMLVPVAAIVLGAIATAIGYGLDATTRLNVAFSTGRLNLSHTRLTELATALAIATLAAMFVGAMTGGGLGSRWHTKLERRADAEWAETGAVPTPATSRRTVDLRDNRDNKGQSERDRETALAHDNLARDNLAREKADVDAEEPVVQA